MYMEGFGRERSWPIIRLSPCAGTEESHGDVLELSRFRVDILTRDIHSTKRGF
jgi:hypothetical protein